MKGEAAALSVHAQCCQSHYFSATPRTHTNINMSQQNGMNSIKF